MDEIWSNSPTQTAHIADDEHKDSKGSLLQNTSGSDHLKKKHGYIERQTTPEISHQSRIHLYSKNISNNDNISAHSLILEQSWFIQIAIVTIHEIFKIIWFHFLQKNETAEALSHKTIVSRELFPNLLKIEPELFPSVITFS